MTTGKKRVASYLPSHLADAFSDYKLNHRLGESEAIAKILEECFFGDKAESHQGLEGFNKRLRALEERFSRLSSIVVGGSNERRL